MCVFELQRVGRLPEADNGTHLQTETGSDAPLHAKLMQQAFPITSMIPYPQRRIYRPAMTLAEVMVTVAVSTILMGVVASLLFGLRKWDRSLREHSVQNEQLIRLAETIRADMREAVDVTMPSEDVLIVDAGDAGLSRYELSRQGCRRILATPGEANARIDLFAVGPAKSWGFERRVGRLPMIELTMNRETLEGENRAAPLVVRAALGADASRP
jgi:hypothetical protein